MTFTCLVQCIFSAFIFFYWNDPRALKTKISSLLLDDFVMGWAYVWVLLLLMVGGPFYIPQLWLLLLLPLTLHSLPGVQRLCIPFCWQQCRPCLEKIRGLPSPIWHEEKIHERVESNLQNDNQKALNSVCRYNSNKHLHKNSAATWSVF